MQELWPNPTDDLNIGERLAADVRHGPVDRPWVTLVMIMSLDGGIAVDGLSGGLGGPADHDRFVAARRQADGIVVGARTAAAEDYRPAAVPIAVVTGSLSLDPAARLFTDPDCPPLLYTTTQAAMTRGPVFDGIAEVRDFGDSLEPGRILADLRGRGMLSVVLEGGPTLNGHFLAADVVDEVLLSVSPLALGGDSPRMAHGTSLGSDHRFSVDRISLADDLIFVRYLRQRSS